MVLTGNSFVNNTGEFGPAVFSSSNAYTYDAGGNSASGNQHCNGVENGIHQLRSYLDCRAFD